MNKFLRGSILILCLGSAVSCSKEKVEIVEDNSDKERPFANYHIEATEDPFVFYFNNESTGYHAVEWRFGDDSLGYTTSPTHQYMEPGAYEVNLKIIAKDGSTARKLLKVEINADSLAKFSADGTGEENTVKFELSTKFPVKSVNWDFGDNTTSDALSPVKLYDGNFIGIANVVITAENGSKVKVSKSVTNHGTASSLFVDVPGNFHIDWESKSSQNELFEKIHDGLINTKFLTLWETAHPIVMTWQPDVPVIADFYTITSADDAPERDPKSWILEGSLDGENFVTLDSRADEKFAKRFQTKLYTFKNQVAYKYYRLHVKEKFGSGNLLQIAEWTMYRKQ